MKIKELLEAIIAEQKQTNKTLEAIMTDAKKQVESVSNKTGQADLIMQQALQILNKHAGG